MFFASEYLFFCKSTENRNPSVSDRKIVSLEFSIQGNIEEKKRFISKRIFLPVLEKADDI